MIALPQPRPSALRARMDSSLAVVNIVLLLLFFFITAGHRQQPEGAITPPGTSGLPLAGVSAPVLTVGGDGQWALDGQPLAPELLAAALPPQPGTVLHLVVAGDAPASLLLATIEHPALVPYRLRLVTVRGPTAP